MLKHIQHALIPGFFFECVGKHACVRVTAAPSSGICAGRRHGRSQSETKYNKSVD